MLSIIIIICEWNSTVDYSIVRHLNEIKDREICCYSISCKEKSNIGMFCLFYYMFVRISVFSLFYYELIKI